MDEASFLEILFFAMSPADEVVYNATELCEEMRWLRQDWESWGINGKALTPEQVGKLGERTKLVLQMVRKGYFIAGVKLGLRLAHALL